METFKRFYFERLYMMRGQFNKLSIVRAKAVQYEELLTRQHARVDEKDQKSFAMLIEFVRKLTSI